MSNSAYANFKLVGLSAVANYIGDRGARHTMQAHFDTDPLPEKKMRGYVLFTGKFDFFAVHANGESAESSGAESGNPHVPEVHAECTLLVHLAEQQVDLMALAIQLWPHMRSFLISQTGMLGLDLAPSMPYAIKAGELHAS